VAAAPTLTIRNLTVTPLELKLVERLSHEHHLSKVTSRIIAERRSHEENGSGEQQEGLQPSSAKQTITDAVISPFSEYHAPFYPLDPTRHHEQIRLTFEDPSTKHRYTADIPSSSPRSIVLNPIRAPSTDLNDANDAEAETKEFTAIYFPSHSYLAIFSSANLSSWMLTLPDHLALSSLSIPGTHNSPTHHVALPSVRCQAVPVLEQLHNGVRFLDVRVSCPVYKPSSSSPSGISNSPPPELALVHSAFPVSLTGPKHLSTLLETVYTFLTTHPSETILLSLKREGTGRGSDADLARILTQHYITPSTWYTAARIPTLAECRGRIVLVRRFHLPNSKDKGKDSELGIDASVWPDNVADGMCGSGMVRIQDYYGVINGDGMRRKVQYVQEGLQRAAQVVHHHHHHHPPLQDPSGVMVTSSSTGVGDGGDGKVGGERGVEKGPAPLYINFLSASSFFNASCWPDRIAVKINPSIVEYLCMEHGAPGKGPGQLTVGDAATGIVVTDWVGNNGDWDLIRCIVGWNARLLLRQ
jgi:1-phosphatidylinositol phosphodiesterase